MGGARVSEYFYKGAKSKNIFFCGGGGGEWERVGGKWRGRGSSESEFF